MQALGQPRRGQFFDSISVMKLRTTSNSIRLRLSQTDVRAFAEHGAIEEELIVNAAGGQRFVYRLERDPNAVEVGASLVNNRLTVSVPARVADVWTSTELVGFENDGASSAPGILVEKDFNCLEPRAGEDDKDTFPHPRSGQNC